MSDQLGRELEAAFNGLVNAVAVITASLTVQQVLDPDRITALLRRVAADAPAGMDARCFRMPIDAILQSVNNSREAPPDNVLTLPRAPSPE